MSINDKAKREFERFNVSLKAEVTCYGELDAEVTSLDDIATGHSETTVLLDISGGGTRFITSRPEHYSIGDRVDITIHLPDAGSESASIKGSGKVAWMGELKDGEMSIGLCMNDLLVFDTLGSESK
jgi:hypothetical protein